MSNQSNITILKEIAELLNEETELFPMLKDALSKLLNGTKFDTGWIFFINDKGKAELIVHENLPEALATNGCAHLKSGGCWCVSRYRKDELKKASNIIECQRIENALEECDGDTEGITHHATVPLQSGQERFGILNVASKNTVRFSDSDLELLESVAFQLGSAIKRIYLVQEQQQIALVQERNRLARDLHDSVNQLLFSVTLTARAGVEMSELPEVKETFQEIQQLTQDALIEMRTLIWQLRPKGLEAGLIEAIKNYADVLGLKLHANVSGVIQFPSRVEEALFRMMQEALNNVRKHAEVSEAELFLHVTSTDILVVIKDNGRGFQMDNDKKLHSFGLQSIQDRAHALHGSAEWVTEIDKGTELLIRLPY
ncbi:MAG: GAF domain-containing sensor histidine kinase [Lysinibacillus sp.]